MSLGFGIIGCGTIANWHVAGIRGNGERAHVVGAADAKPQFSENFCKKYGVRQFMSVEELLASPEIQVVSICTPSGLHAPYAIAAAKAGKHVIVEKPMALTVAEADEVIAASEQHHVLVCVISQYRFSDAVQKLRAAISAGKLGRLVTGDVFMKYYRSQEYYDVSGWRGTWKMDGGGALMNQGIHGVDALQYLMGPVKSVFGYARTLARRIEVEDTASAVLEFENGALGIIQGTTSVYPGMPRRLSISGTKGSITLSESLFEQWSIEGEEVPADVVLGGEQKSGASNPTEMDTAGHIMQIGDMIDAIETGRQPLVSCYDGKKPVQIITAIYESSKTGKKIDLSM